jgi:predicted nucleotidyltransferase component of viral defense system
MIAEICFTADWLDKKRKELKGVDPSLLERALHAFALLGHLAESDLKFVFKGGTSLLLHVPVIRRLSIDMSLRFCLSGNKGARLHADVALLEEGRRKLEGHLVDHRFDQQAANHEAFWYWYQASRIS